MEEQKQLLRARTRAQAYANRCAQVARAVASAASAANNNHALAAEAAVRNAVYVREVAQLRDLALSVEAALWAVYTQHPTAARWEAAREAAYIAAAGGDAGALALAYEYQYASKAYWVAELWSRN